MKEGKEELGMVLHAYHPIYVGSINLYGKHK
jgi:hypothetical protein